MITLGDSCLHFEIDGILPHFIPSKENYHKCKKVCVKRLLGTNKPKKMICDLQRLLKQLIKLF